MHVSVLHPNLLNPNKRRTPEHSLEEAVSLANALDIEILHEAVIPLKKPNAGT
ncbi:MAG: GTPase HflX, partial [Rhodobacterales bacterium]|nr:GTPase HflX [Rhodobacterales bacterium]